MDNLERFVYAATMAVLASGPIRHVLRVAVPRRGYCQPLLSKPTWSVKEVLPDPNSTDLPSAESVLSAAALAQLPLSEEDLPQARKNIGDLLHFVQYIHRIDTENVEPLTTVVRHSAPLRDDSHVDDTDAQSILSNAQQIIKGHFSVRKG